MGYYLILKTDLFGIRKSIHETRNLIWFYNKKIKRKHGLIKNKWYVIRII
jgi:hypothetical protein